MRRGVELARSNGFYSLDPLIDITLPDDGPYLLRIRDLLHRGNPDSVYRLTGGVLPYNTYLFPAGGTVPNEEMDRASRTEATTPLSYGPPTPPKINTVQCVIGGENLPETEWQVKLTPDDQPGLKQIRTPYGIFPFVVNAHPESVEADIEHQSTPDEPATQDNTTTQLTESEILFETKCSACHELRSPSNRALSAEEWTNTITRMMK